ncbi:MAG: hypothetical protein HY671_05745 [Chloroflexi bacterium]|nr:hypothetical protein [Chloroflexota bacterium]
MTRVWFGGVSWCPRHERSMLLLRDKSGRPVLGIQVPLSRRELILDDMARTTSGNCSAQKLLLALLDSLHLGVEAVVFEEGDGLAGARIRLAGNPARSFSTDDPVAAAILAVSLGTPMYMRWPAGTVLMSQAPDAEESGADELPEVFSKFLQDSQALETLHSKGDQPVDQQPGDAAYGNGSE